MTDHPAGLDLAAIEGRLEKVSEWALRATPLTDDTFDLHWGWEAEIWTDSKGCGESGHDDDCHWNDRVAAVHDPDMADFFAHAPTDVRDLLTEVRALRAVAAAARELTPQWSQFEADNEHADMAFMRLIDAVRALDADAPHGDGGE